ALARALLLEPPLLLLDEPTGNLDRDTEIAIVDLLLELQREGLTLICASHSEYMMAHADRVMVLAGGKLSPKTVSRKRSRMV
ncbi:MAG: MacB family efflux pump subunit, partial [Turneriella sp.]|nr:MacB family efflux pump subunit [Turneriella sp.]